MTLESILAAAREELTDRYGALPKPVETLLRVAELRLAARAQGISEIAAAGSSVRFAPVELPDSVQVRLARLYPSATIKPATRTIVLPKPRPKQFGARDVSDDELLDWVAEVLRAVKPAASVSAKEKL